MRELRPGRDGRFQALAVLRRPASTSLRGRGVDPGFLDRLVHRVRRKVKLPWPRERAPLEIDLAKGGRITKRLEHASVGRMDEGFQINLAFEAIVENDAQPPRADDRGGLDVPGALGTIGGTIPRALLASAVRSWSMLPKPRKVHFWWRRAHFSTRAFACLGSEPLITRNVLMSICAW